MVDRASHLAIRAEQLGKVYRVDSASAQHQTLREAMSGFAQRAIGPLRGERGGRASSQFWALRGVSFEIEAGEVVGVIGRNGAGKSTLLKILSRVTAPTEGRAIVNGRVGSLLEVGTGFHSELTGRENIFLSGAILGMTRKEIARNFDDIVEFSGVEQFLDTPVKRYSSGMYMRLAFAVAAHLEPEILCVDEVLAVGDAAFQQKCLGKMGSVARSGRTILFVSHNMGAVSRLCTKAMVLSSGQLEFWGSVEDAIAHYVGSRQVAHESVVDLRHAPGWDRERRVLLTSVSLHTADGTPTTEFQTGETIVLRIRYKVDEATVAYCQLGFSDLLQQRIMTVRSSHGGGTLELRGEGTIECVMPHVPLAPGHYTIQLELGREFPRVEWLDCVPDATSFEMVLGDYLAGGELLRGQGVLAQRSQWSLE